MDNVILFPKLNLSLQEKDVKPVGPKNEDDGTLSKEALDTVRESLTRALSEEVEDVFAVVDTKQGRTVINFSKDQEKLIGKLERIKFAMLALDASGELEFDE